MRLANSRRAGTQAGPDPHRGARLLGVRRASRLPAIGDGTHYTDLGFLMSYSFDWSEIVRMTASYINKILKGAQPADMPIEQVTKFEFVVNMKTARTLGVRIPLEVHSRTRRSQRR